MVELRGMGYVTLDRQNLGDQANPAIDDHLKTGQR